MSVEGCSDEPPAVLQVQGDVPDKLAIDEVSAALVQQAHQLMNLASVLHSNPSIADENNPELFRADASSRGIFFQEGRNVQPDTRDLARKAYRSRRMRETIFNEPGLFGEPAWDILLDLSIAHEAGVRVSVSSACVGGCVPSTTALRWLSILEGKGLVERVDDLLDGRRTYVRLTRKGLSRMDEYLRATRDI